MNEINQLIFTETIDLLTENIEIDSFKKEQLDTIAKSFFSYIILIDKLFDKEIQIDSDTTLNNPLQNLTDYHEISIKTLTNLYGNNSIIFDIKSKYSKIYFNAIVKEKLWDSNSYILSKNEFEKISVEKHIPVFFIVEGIKLLNNNFNEEGIKKMLSHIFRGIQMYDDITDIGEDLENNQFTYIISNTIQYLKNDDDYYPDNISYTHKAFFAIEELCNLHFEYMIEQFSIAKQIALENNLNKMVSWIETIINQINDWKNKIDYIRNA